MRLCRLFLTTFLLHTLANCKPGPSKALDRIQEFTGLVIDNKSNPRVQEWEIQGAGVGGDYLEDYKASFEVDKMRKIIDQIIKLENSIDYKNGYWSIDSCTFSFFYSKYNSKSNNLDYVTFDFYVDSCNNTICYQFTID